MNFAEQISKYPVDDVAIIQQGRRNTPYGEISARADIVKNGVNIAICTEELDKAISAMAAFDGVAQSILFLSSQYEADLIAELSQNAEIDIILCDSDHRALLENCAPQIADNLEHAIEISNSVAVEREPQKATRWILSTSGTTGTPKLVPHTLESLTRTTVLKKPEDTQYRWALLYDYTRFAGLQVVLQAVLSGSILLSPDMSKGLNNSVQFLAENGCTNISATPTFWKKLVMSPAISKLNPNAITLGGEIVDEKILTTLKNIFPNAKLRHIFASTEAGVGFSVSDGHAGFPQSYLENPPAGIEIKIGEDNHLMVRNPFMDGHYINSDKKFTAEEGWVDTGDVMQIENNRVYFLGRDSGLINVGGDKVYPEEIEQILTKFEHILDARVFAKSNPFSGQIVIAEIVLDIEPEEQKEYIEDVQSKMRAELPLFKVPAILMPVENIEIGISGKVIRSK